MADNSETIIVKYVAEVEGLKAGLKSVQASVTELAKSNEELQKKLTDAFEKPAEKVQSLKSRLKELKAQLAEATDPKEVERLAKAAGKLTDQIQDAGDAAKVFASESKFEQIGTALGGVGGKLRNLDFKGALDQSRLLVSATKGLTFKEGLQGVKDLGATLGNVGKALLFNPIFLLGAAIALIVTNFDALTKSGGLVGNIFGSIKEAINGVIEGFTAFTDSIGLTDSKAASLREYKKVLDEIKVSAQEGAKAVADSIEQNNIKILQNLGKISEKEAKIQQARIDTQKAIDELEKKQRQAVTDALDKLGISADSKRLKDVEKREKVKNDIEFAYIQEAIGIRNKYESDIDLINSEGIEKEREKNQKAAEEKAKALKAELKQLQKIKDDASKQLEKESGTKNTELEVAQATEEEKLLIAKSGEAERLKAIFDASNQTITDKANLANALLGIEKKYNIDVAALRNKNADDAAKTNMELQKAAEAEADAAMAITGKQADDDLAKKKKDRKDNFNDTVQIAQETLSILETLSNQRTERELADAQERSDKQNELYKEQLDNNLISKKRYDQLVAKNNKKLAAEELKIKKEAFERDKSIAITNAIIQTALNVVKAYGEGGPAGIILAVLAAAAGAIQIAAIENAPPPKFEKGGKVNGNRHFAGGTLIEAEKDEFVINRKEALKHDKLLEAINNGRADKYIHEMYLAPVLKQTAKRIREQQSKDFASNIANSMMLQNEFKDVNILDSLKMSRQNDKEIAHYIVKHINPNINKYNW
jgi:hypothetical protein